MPSLNAAARRLLVLCELIPLPDMTQEDVDFLLQRLVEDAPSTGEGDEHPTRHPSRRTTVPKGGPA